MALTTEEQKLLDFALSNLPSWYSDGESRDMAIEAGMAKMVGLARAQAAYWFSQTLITGATGPATGTPDWLQQHALDRDTRRSIGEADSGLQERLQQYPDSINRGSLVSVAQAIVDAAGVTGIVAMVELRRDRGYLVKNEYQDGSAGGGGVFSAGSGTQIRFTPNIGWAGGRPPFRGAGIEPPIGYRLIINSSTSNDGTFPILGLHQDAVVYDNPSGAVGSYPTLEWFIYRLDRDGNQISSYADAFLSRGHRMGTSRAALVVILPYGVTAAVAASVEEAIRQRKAAGVRVIIERRQSP